MSTRIGKKMVVLLVLAMVLGMWTGLGFAAEGSGTNPAGSTVTTQDVVVIDFPDANLAAAIRTKLGLGAGADITTANIAYLTSLEAPSAGISDLTGLNNATKLTYLFLQNNQIADLSPISGLTTLREISFTGNQVSDLTPLAGLTGLQDVALGSNQLTDVSPLAGLTAIYDLDLEYNQLTDISALANMPLLQEIRLYGNDLTSLAPLSGLNYLVSVNATDNDISDLSPLAGKTYLTALYIWNNQVSDLSPLEGCINLGSLGAGNNQITDISALADLTDMVYLDLDVNSVSDISVLQGMTYLVNLNLAANQVEDISSLAGLNYLATVDLTYNNLDLTVGSPDMTVIDGLIAGGAAVDYSPQWGGTVTYSVSYNGNGNTGGAVPTDSNPYAQGASVTVKSNTGALVKAGYAFAGWNTAANGSGTNYAAGATLTMGTANVTLYARWTAATYTVTYNGNGNTSGTVPVDSNTYAQGATVTVKSNTGSLAKTGYTFAGWNTAANGSGTDYLAWSTFSMGSANVTLYAQWSGGTPSDVEAFVTRFYEQCLQREPSAGEVAYWAGKLNAGTATGADVAYGFVFSDEFIARNVSNAAYLDILYQAFFDRDPDTPGYNYWLTQLGSGTERLTVLAGFVNADEFEALCTEYGITPGSIEAGSADIEAFVTRFYEECLGRTPDQAGLDYWVSRLESGAKTGADVAYGFIYSDEFQARGVSNSEYLEVLYYAFFDREPDTTGYNYWLGRLTAATDRLTVLAGFVNADEFQDLCAAYGITPGEISG